MSVRTGSLLAVCVLGTLGFASAGEAATAALVEFTIGNASAIDAAGTARPLAKGAAVQAGDTIDTGNGRVQLRFSDGAYVSLQPGSQFRIDEYNYNGKNDETERGFFSLIKGGLRTITGLVGRSNRRNYQVRVPVATIGIRGTEYTLMFDGAAVGSVGEGEIAVCNNAGCLNVASGQAYVVAGVNIKPELTAVQSFLPAPPPPRNIARRSLLEPVNPADSYMDGSSLLVAGDEVKEGADKYHLRKALVIPDDLQPFAAPRAPPPPPHQPPTPAPTPAPPPLLLQEDFGEQIGNSGTPVTTQSVVLSLATQVFTGAFSSVEPGTITFSTLANVQGGRLISFSDAGVSTPVSTIGTAGIADRGNLGLIAWGRFVSGTLGNGSVGGNPGSFAGKVVTATDSLHYVVARPTPVNNLPTGSVGFATLAGATTPTTGSGTAQLVSAGLLANFTT